MNTFNLDESKSTYYIDYKQKGAYTISSLPIEKSNIEDLIEAILEEFTNSSIEEKQAYKPMLKEWLYIYEKQELLSSEKVLLEKESAEVLDNIYEMF